MKITTNKLLLAGGAFVVYKYFLHGQIFGGTGGTVTLPPGGPTGNAALDCLSKGGFWGPPGGGAMPSGGFSGYQCWPSFEAYRQASMQQ